jgi:hypothetical protein
MPISVIASAAKQSSAAARTGLLRRCAPRNDEQLSSLPDLIRQSMLTASMRTYWVYILASRPRGTLYVGVTRDLVRRIYEHREGAVKGFTSAHNVKMLVY